MRHLRKHAEILTLFWKNATKLQIRVKDKLQLFDAIVVYEKCSLYC